jgi:hypothetical protein
MKWLLFAILPLAWGHQPADLGAEFEVENPYISYAVNGSFPRRSKRARGCSWTRTPTPTAS